jgi:hypothetical protein
VFDHPTVAALAEYLERNFLMVAEDAAEPGAEPQPEDERARTLSELQQMSDEDAEAILAKELSGST